MDIFVARQPIFDKKRKVYGYELLYRSGGVNNSYDANYGDQATSEVITNSFLIGLEKLTDGKRAFVNFTDNLLKSEAVTLLPKDLVAIEVLETAENCEKVTKACQELKKKGYMIVLDDFDLRRKSELMSLIELADIIKIDFRKTSVQQRREVVQTLGQGKINFLAEKIESKEEFDHAVKMGYSYFQGFFFSKPMIISGKDISSQKINYLQIIMEMNKTEIDIDGLENIIKRDVSISYKLLTLINSTSYGFAYEIKSIKQALLLLGLKEFKKWMVLVVFKLLGEEKPSEILKNSIVRARFGELLAPKIGLATQSSEAFILGMFSSIDVILDKSMDDVLRNLPVLPGVKAALLTGQGPMGELLQFILAYERGDWDFVKNQAAKLNIKENEIPPLFIEAVKWTNKFSE